MEIGNLWLIPISIFLNISLYWVQKRYLVKWFCRTFLSKSVQLECDLSKAKQSSASGCIASGSTPNGLIANDHDGLTSTTSHEKGTYYGKKLVTDGEVNGVAMENVGSLIAFITAIVSAIVMIQTRHDIIYARSPFLIPWCHIAAWYFVVDVYNMYDAFRAKNDISHLSALGRYSLYLKAKWPFVTHHVVLFIFGYTIVVNDSLRGFKGDFLVAVIIGEDFSNPLVNTAKVLKMLGQNKTMVYMLNGFLLVIVFFVVRILNIPIAFLIYAAQYHNWNIVAAIHKLKFVCYLAIGSMYILQFYWFVKIVKVALQCVANISQRQSEPINQKKAN